MSLSLADSLLEAFIGILHILALKYLNYIQHAFLLHEILVVVYLCMCVCVCVCVYLILLNR